MMLGMLTGLEVIVAWAIRLSVARFIEHDRYEPNAVSKGELASRERKYGMAVIMAVISLKTLINR